MIASERLYPIAARWPPRCQVPPWPCWGGFDGTGRAGVGLATADRGVCALPAPGRPHQPPGSLFATLAMSAVARLGFINSAHVMDFQTEILGMLFGGVAASMAQHCWRISKAYIMAVIAGMLLATAALLATEALL